MSKSAIINEVSSNTGLTKVEIEAVLGEIIDSISGSLKRGERVELRDVFTIEPKTQKPGFKRNPKSGTTFFAKEKKKIFFKMSKKWTKKINEK